MLARRCMSARDVATLSTMSGEIKAVAVTMVGEGAGSSMIARTLSALNDALSGRVMELVAQRYRLPNANWGWLAFGSEGRCEQTFVTDQDNGIVFSAVDAAEARALRPHFLAFAGEVNQVLAACGFPLCSGGIMAGNPECCLAESEWQMRFAAWIRTPEPQALLNATIFFDFRHLFGQASLAAALRTSLARSLTGADAFMRMLADNALAAEPPIGVLRDFVMQDGKVDLKKYGARIFVDAARVLGLVCPTSNTIDRLRHAVSAGSLPEADGASAITAFRALQRIRLSVQLARKGTPDLPDNQIEIDSMNRFDRHVLHECLKQARMLQERLKSTYRIEG